MRADNPLQSHSAPCSQGKRRNWTGQSRQKGFYFNTYVLVNDHGVRGLHPRSSDQRNEAVPPGREELDQRPEGLCRHGDTDTGRTTTPQDACAPASRRCRQLWKELHRVGWQQVNPAGSLPSLERRGTGEVCVRIIRKGVQKFRRDSCEPHLWRKLPKFD